MNIEIPQWFSTIGGLIGYSSLLQWAINRRYQRKDGLQKQRIDAFREVFSAIGLLRSTGNQLVQAWDWNTPPQAQNMAPTVQAIASAYDVIELKRIDTGAAFADAAKSVVAFWDQYTDEMWNRDAEGSACPSLAEREAALLATVPSELHDRVAPGH